MARTGIRFRPPRFLGSPEIDWALLRAFGAADPVALEGLDQEATCEVARRLLLQPRIRSRIPRELLEAEIGSQAVAAFDRETVLQAGMLVQHEQACRDLASLAQGMSVPLILLKGMALHFHGVISPGGRRIADIDVLVPRESSERFHRALIESGCEPSGIRAPDHHLSVLRHSLGSAIEVHHEIDGVRLDEDGYATAGQCFDIGLVVRSEGMETGVYLPSRPLLVAHLLAHGLSHHGKAPDSYPALQMLADLQDVTSDPIEETPVPDEALDWIALDVSRDEAEATMALVRDLSRGVRASDLLRGEDSTAVLLRHLLAGSLSEEYRRALRLSRRLDPPGGQGRMMGVTRTAWQAVWLSRTQVEMLYGKPRTKLGYLGWRLWRPFDVAGRTVQSAVAWLRLRRDR